MELYIKWSFWLGVAAIAINLCYMSTATYPRKWETSLGSDVVKVIISGFFAVWAWSLIYR